VATVDVGGVRERQQPVTMLPDFARNDLPIAAARAAIVRLQRQLADALQVADGLAQRFLF
jgi:hypothetical protein